MPWERPRVTPCWLLCDMEPTLDQALRCVLMKTETVCEKVNHSEGPTRERRQSHRHTEEGCLCYRRSSDHCLHRVCAAFIRRQRLYKHRTAGISHNGLWRQFTLN